MPPMRGYKIYLSYPDDSVTEWVNARILAIGVCLNSELPEAVLTLIYSGIDVIGWLDAPGGQQYAKEGSFVTWAERYISPTLHAIDGEQVKAADLYSARCGILHVSSPMSSGTRKGETREIWYQFGGGTGGHALAVTGKELQLVVDLEVLERTFRDGCDKFLSELKSDSHRFKKANERAQQLLKWGMGSIMSDEEVEAYRADERAKQRP